jgi:hypothetical protein
VKALVVALRVGAELVQDGRAIKVGFTLPHLPRRQGSGKAIEVKPGMFGMSVDLKALLLGSK